MSSADPVDYRSLLLSAGALLADYAGGKGKGGATGHRCPLEVWLNRYRHTGKDVFDPALAFGAIAKDLEGSIRDCVTARPGDQGRSRQIAKQASGLVAELMKRMRDQQHGVMLDVPRFALGEIPDVAAKVMTESGRQGMASHGRDSVERWVSDVAAMLGLARQGTHA